MTPDQAFIELAAQAFVDWYLRYCGPCLQRLFERMVCDAHVGSYSVPMSRQEKDVVDALYRALQLWHSGEIGPR